MEYFYFINLNERGDFYADVRDINDKTIFEINGFNIFEDGFMRHDQDLNGLADYLISLNLITNNDILEFGA